MINRQFLKLNRGLLATSVIVALTTASVPSAYAVSDEVAVQLLERLSDLEQELSNLRGENEMLRNELKDIQNTQREGFLEVDERVSGLEKKRKIGLQDSTIAPATSESTTGSLPIPSVTGTTDPLPALEDPAARTATTTTGTGNTNAVTATTTPTTTTGDPAVEVNLNTDPLRGVASTDVADQRRAIAPATAATQAGSDNQTGKIDPNSPDSYYYYGTQDKNKQNQADTSKASHTAEKAVNAEKPLIPDSHKAKAAYNQAYKLLVNDPKAAVPAFRTFMQNYPDHELVANAQYWLGEALYAQKDYSAATEEFIQVLKKHKGSPKAPGAALKLGYSFYELRQWDFARRTLEDTVKFFPGTNAATLAKSRLERMSNEGR